MVQVSLNSQGTTNVKTQKRFMANAGNSEAKTGDSNGKPKDTTFHIVATVYNLLH